MHKPNPHYFIVLITLLLQKKLSVIIMSMTFALTKPVSTEKLIHKETISQLISKYFFTHGQNNTLNLGYCD